MIEDRSNNGDIEVQTIAEHQFATAVDLLTLAFSSDPPTRFVWPDPTTYLASFRPFAIAFGGSAVGARTAYHTPGMSAVALWLPPGASSDGDALADLIERTAPADRKGDAFATFRQMRDFHPREPHWYLPLTGVDPVDQGRGLGSTLLRHALARIDAEGLSAYLENSNRRNIPFYERAGFEVVGRIGVGDYPPLFPMIRPPRGLAEPR